MKKYLALLCIGVIFWNGVFISVSEALSVARVSGTTTSAGSSINILSEGITATNAGKILSQESFTSGKFELSEKKFTLSPGVQVALDSKIGESFKLSLVTRANFLMAKNKSGFTAKAEYLDTITEYPDRVRIISKTAYSYNNKAEYESIFGSFNSKEEISPSQVQDFIRTHKEYSKYTAWIPKADKQAIISHVANKLYAQCIKDKRMGATCDKNTITNTTANEIEGYKGIRTVTETIDVNKIPMIYDADKNKNFIDRLKASNLSKEPQEVRISKANIQKAFDQMTALQIDSSKVKLPTLSQSAPKAKSCDGLTGAHFTACKTELDLLEKNSAWNNTPVVYSAELLNGFTLGESYSYKLSDSYSVLGFTVYDIGVSFYAGYGVGIRVPIDTTVSISKNRLEKGGDAAYQVEVSATTKDKDKAWFTKALGANKAFDGKEAVLEAGAYAKGWIILLEKTVFSGQIGGKKDWGSSLTIPSGNEKTPIFSGEVKGEQIGLDLILSGIHISGDLKAEWSISGNISYECRTLSSTGVTGDASKCRNLEHSQLSDSDVPDISLDTSTKKSSLSLKAESEKFFYKNDLGIYQPYGVSLERFKYNPELTIDLSLRGKVGVNTGDYFGWYWMETPWLKVYSFSLDLPTLTAHTGYKTKTVGAYEKNYLYNFSSTSQDIAPGDTSVKYPAYSISSRSIQKLDKQKVPASSFVADDKYPEDYSYNYGYGGKAFYKNDSTIITQKNSSCNDNNGFKNCYHLIGTSHIVGSSPSRTKTSYFGHTRDFEYSPTQTVRPFAKDYLDNKTSELQFANSSRAYYYSEATNALWSANISGAGAANALNLKAAPGIKKLVTLKSDNLRPRKEVFSNPGDVAEYMIPPTFQKFQFAFHPDFSESTSKSENTFAYIDKDNGVQVYRKGKWTNVELGVLEGEPVYVQISRSPLDPKESDMTVITKNSEKYYIYTFEYQDPLHTFVRNSLYSQKSFVVKDYTAFYFDISKKILYAALREELANKRFRSKIVALRFNGNEQSVFEREFIVYQQNKQAFLLSYEDAGNDAGIDFLPENAISSTFIQSLSVDTQKNVLTFVGLSEMIFNAYDEPYVYSVQEAVAIPFTLRLLDVK